MGLWAKAKEADANYSVLSWLPTIFQFLFPSAAGLLVAYFASYRDWIWNDYGMFGLCVIAMATALIASVAFALTGIGVRLFWPIPTPILAPQPLSAPQTARRPVSGLEVVQRLERLEATKGSSPSETPKNNKPYNAQDTDRLQDIFFELRQFINGEPKEIEKDLKNLRLHWYTQIAQDGSSAYVMRLRNAAAASQNITTALNELIYQKHAHYKNEVRTALCLDEEWFPKAATSNLITFATKVDALPEKTEIKTVRVLEESWGQLLDLTGVQFERWIPQVNDRIDAMSHNLRKLGVTGFEK